jgi:hypothetical protein
MAGFQGGDLAGSYQAGIARPLPIPESGKAAGILPAFKDIRLSL